jgi:hypothetical protein
VRRRHPTSPRTKNAVGFQKASSLVTQGLEQWFNGNGRMQLQATASNTNDIGSNDCWFRKGVKIKIDRKIRGSEPSTSCLLIILSFITSSAIRIRPPHNIEERITSKCAKFHSSQPLASLRQRPSR